MSGAIIDHPIARECPIVNKPAFFSGGLELVVRAMKSRNPTHATKTAGLDKTIFLIWGWPQSSDSLLKFNQLSIEWMWQLLCFYFQAEFIFKGFTHVKDIVKIGPVVAG